MRDATLGRDARQVRTGAAPQILAALRNLTIALLHRAGHTNSAAGVRALGWQTQSGAALRMLGIRLP